MNFSNLNNDNRVKDRVVISLIGVSRIYLFDIYFSEKYFWNKMNIFASEQI